MLQALEFTTEGQSKLPGEMMQPKLIIKYIEAYQLQVEKSPGGYCHGLASLARDAYLLGEEEYTRYRTRLEYMNKTDFLNQMQAFIQEEKLLTEGDISLSVFSAEKLLQWPLLTAYAAISLKKPQAEIKVNDLYAIYIETRAFLETMTILQGPKLHDKELFSKPMITQGDPKTLALMPSCLAEQKGGINKASIFIDFSSRKNIADYLNEISSIQTEKRFTIMLHSNDHVIALFYDRKTKQWILDNHGYKTVFREYKSPLHWLINTLINLFKGKKIDRDLASLPGILRYAFFGFSLKRSSLATDIYSLDSDKKAVTEAFLPLQRKKLSQLDKQLSKTEVFVQEMSSLLELALSVNSIETVKRLLVHPKCDPNRETKEGRIPLNTAVVCDEVEVAKALLAHPKCDPNREDKKGRTPLTTAVVCDRVEVGKALLAHPKCDPNREAKAGITPLTGAVVFGRVDLGKALLAHPKCDPNREDKEGITPLTGAVFLDRVELGKALLAHPKCDPNREDKEGITPLTTAVFCNRVELGKALRAHPKCDPTRHIKRPRKNRVNESRRSVPHGGGRARGL